MRFYLLAITFLLNLPIKAQYFEYDASIPLTQTNNDSRSANWVDLNNDGFLDIFITNGKSSGQNNVLYWNDGFGNFSRELNHPIVQDNEPSDGATFADAANSGALSLFVANWHDKKNLYYLNDSIHGFVQTAAGIAPAEINSNSETGSFGDYDNDGYVDLYVSNSYIDLENFLYKNNGDGTFTRDTIVPLTSDLKSSRSVNWIDYDNDGDQDLFVSNENNESNDLYRNDDSIFTKITAGPLVTDQHSSMSSTWGDFDNDGDFDVFVSNFNQKNVLYRNEGNDLFTAVLNDTVSKNFGRSFCANWADIDNDGDLDLYVGNAFSTGNKLRSFLYINDGQGNFSRNSSDTVTKVLSWTYGNAFGDYDRDGDMDLLTANCHGGAEANRLFENMSSDNSSNNWLVISLEGVMSNRSAIGAKVRVRANISGQNVWQLREVSGQHAYCGQNMLAVHFGLGDAANVDSIQIEWPSGLVEGFSGIAASNYYSAKEGQGLQVINVSLKSNIESQFIKISPNPANDKIQIQLEDKIQESPLMIYDLEGKILRNQMIYSSNLDIDISKLDSGLYLIKIEMEGKEYFTKFIKE